MTISLITLHIREQEFHSIGRKTAGTMVLEELNAEDVIDALTTQLKQLKLNPITINIGASFLYPSDQFNKKEGRRIAISRLKPIKFRLHISGEQNTNHLPIILKGIDEEMCVVYNIYAHIYSDSRKLRIIKASMREITINPTEEG